MDTLPDIQPTVIEIPAAPARALKDYLVGPKSNILPAHGWTHSSVLFNHLDENVKKVMDKPMSSLPAVVVARDRPADRAMAANTMMPSPTPSDSNTPILPHTNLILCSSTPHFRYRYLIAPQAIVHTTRKDETDSFTFHMVPVFPDHTWYIGAYVGLSDRLTREEFMSALFAKLIADREAIKLIQENHNRVPDAHDIPFVVQVLLEYADVRMATRRGMAPQRQNATWKDHLMSASFAFVVDLRGRATPFMIMPTRAGRACPMECTECLGLDHYKDDCPITTSPDFRAVCLTQAEIDSANVGTSLGTIRDRDDIDSDGFKSVNYRNTRARFGPTYKRPWGGRGRRGA
ncbi:hypothetical protein C8R46DRAFT_1221844 [Mycena filopes]|nr:hypothetical protein C8R46DRAFT_1221844 [Mycena filopes]